MPQAGVKFLQISAIWDDSLYRNQILKSMRTGDLVSVLIFIHFIEEAVKCSSEGNNGIRDKVAFYVVTENNIVRNGGSIARQRSRMTKPGDCI